MTDHDDEIQLDELEWVFGDEVPYSDIDANVIGLVRELNEWPGMITTSSCGGHRDPGPGQSAEGEWQIFLDLKSDDEERPLLESWLSLEYLAYVCSKRIGGIDLKVFSAAPFLNGFGQSISFIMTGSGDPQATADQLVELRAEFLHFLDRQESEENSFE